MSIEKSQFIEYYVEQARRGNISLFLGAGVSSSTGLPSWAALLKPCADKMGIKIDNTMDLYLVAQYYANEFGESALKRVLNDSINQITQSSDLVQRLLSLNFMSIWTTNYDKVIEENLAQKKVLTNSIFDDRDLPNTTGPNRVNIYKMNGDITNLDRIVITQSDIENYPQNHEMLLTFFKRELVVNTFLFLGYSFTDKVVLSCLSSVNQCLKQSANYHFAVLKRKADADFPYFVKDLEQRYHVRILLIDDYDELPEILTELRKAINRKNIFFSGVFERLPAKQDVCAELLCKDLTAALLSCQYRLYTGYGRNFGNYLAGSAIQYMLANNMEIDRYLVMRPFLKTMTPMDKEIHRKMLLSECKFSIFMFGQSPENGKYVNSHGMMKEYELAREAGKIIIPIGCTQYTAQVIWQDMHNSITLYPYLERYMEELNRPLQIENIPHLVHIILQILQDCSAM